MSELTNFNTNPIYLASNLFCPQRPRIGALTYLNVNILPDFIAYLKQKISSSQLIALSEYQLQTYIMELSIKQKVTEGLNLFVDRILSHIRNSKQFWIHGKIISSKDNQEKQKQQKKHQDQAIAQYPKDVQFIKQKIPQYPQKIFNNIKKRRIQQSIQILIEYNFFDRNKQALKIIYNNYSMMPGYVIKRFYQKNGSIKSPGYNFLKPEQKKMIHSLQQIIEYIIMSLKPKIIKKQYIKTRSLERKRKLPSYLEDKQLIIQNQALNYQAEQIQQEQIENKDIVLEKNDQQQQDEPNEFYNQFHSAIQNKQFYESKMFYKIKQINQSHNILQILNCAFYLMNNKQQKWFQQTWKQLQQQKILRKKKRKQQQQEDSLQENLNQNEGKQISQEENQKQQIKYEKQIKQDHKQTLNKQPSAISNFNNSNSDQFIQIGIKKPIFSDLWKTPHYKFDKLFSNFEVKIFTMREVYFISKQILSKQLNDYSFFRKIQLQTQQKSKSMANALCIPQMDLDLIYNQFKQMIEHPQNIKLSSFKTEGIVIPWSQTDYLMFLKGLLEFFFVPTNNKKIAIYMNKGIKNIQSNHVKYVKNLYLKNMLTRIERGQSGGGKKSRMLGKLQFLQKDIEFFSMKWFQKLKKTKKKRIRRKHSLQDAAQQLDSAY